jgi:hypothetical protein
MKKCTFFGAVFSLVIMTLFGCGGGGGGGDATPPTPGASSTTITGVAAKGPISGGTVKVFAIKDGQVDRAAEIGSGATDGSGAYSVTIPPDKTATGPVLIEVSSGSFSDEATGLSGIALKVPLQAVVSTVTDGDKIAVTPLTHLAVKQVEGIGNFSAQEIDDSNKQVGAFFKVDDIIKSQPFDSTKDAPAGATDDQRKYAGALGIFSQLCDKRRGATKLEDALGTILDDLGKELKDNGGFSQSTLDGFNTATDDFRGKNRGGTLPAKIVFSAGVLQLQTTGSLPADTAIEGIDVSVVIPAGVTIKLDTTGEVAAGVVDPVSKAATGSLVSAKFDAAANTLHFAIISVQPGFDVGEFAHVEFGLKVGFALPSKTDFLVNVNKITGGKKTDPNASIDLVAGGITVNQKSVTGL